MIESCHFVSEKWIGADHFEDSGVCISLVQMHSILQSTRNYASATLSINCNDKTLIIGSSNGMYTATALLGGDQIFDRIVELRSAESVRFIEGGQEVQIPANHILSFEEALGVLQEFCESGAVEATAAWKHQG
jgi:hypothetical protein